MATNLTKDTTNNLWPVPIEVAGSGTTTHLLQTENKFVDANISIKVHTPSASGAALSIADKASTNITIGTLSNGYYPLSTSLTGTLSVSTAGWLTKAGLSAADSNVIVGRIAQSTLANGSTAIASGSTIVPNVSSTQTINISAGYNTARTIVIGAMSSGTQAAAQITASTQATAPTVANTSSAVQGKTQVTTLPATGSTDINKYYVAVTATAPETSFSASSITKSVTTKGYLGETDQITTSATTTTNSTLYYLPLSTGAVSVSGTTTAATPTAANNSNASINQKTRIDVAPTTATSGINTYFMALTINAPATTISLNKTVTAGYISDKTTEVTGSAKTNAKSATYYIPVASTSLVSGAGAAAATSENVNLITSSAQPESGYYITVTGSGTVSTSGTAGWIAANTSKTSNTKTAYYSIPTASFTVVNNVVKTTSTGAGYIGANQTVGTIANGSLSNQASSGITYTEKTAPVLNSGGFLYINAGYYSNQKISLATLVPDLSASVAATSDQMLKGFKAYDSEGNILTGTIETYAGEYTVA